MAALGGHQPHSGISKNFIRSTLKQFAENNGFQAGIWHEGRLAGVVGYHAID